MRIVENIEKISLQNGLLNCDFHSVCSWPILSSFLTTERRPCARGVSPFCFIFISSFLFLFSPKGSPVPLCELTLHKRGRTGKFYALFKHFIASLLALRPLGDEEWTSAALWRCSMCNDFIIMTWHSVRDCISKTTTTTSRGQMQGTEADQWLVHYKPLDDRVKWCRTAQQPSSQWERNWLVRAEHNLVVGEPFKWQNK